MHTVPNGNFEAVKQAKDDFRDGHILLIQLNRGSQIAARNGQIPLEAFPRDGAFNLDQSVWRMGHFLIRHLCYSVVEAAGSIPAARHIPRAKTERGASDGLFFGFRAKALSFPNLKSIKHLVKFWPQETFLLTSSAWNIFQFRHCASQFRQPPRGFPLNQRFEGCSHQSRFIRDSRKIPRRAYQIVIESNCCSHGTSTHQFYSRLMSKITSLPAQALWAAQAFWALRPPSMCSLRPSESLRID
jgi:hypothetical protein